MGPNPNNLTGGSQALYQALLVYFFNPAMLLFFALGLVVFTWGLAEFLWKMQKGIDAKEGKQHMLWGFAGMFIMVAAYGFLRVIASLYGIAL